MDRTRWSCACRPCQERLRAVGAVGAGKDCAKVDRSPREAEILGNHVPSGNTSQVLVQVFLPGGTDTFGFKTEKFFFFLPNEFIMGDLRNVRHWIPYRGGESENGHVGRDVASCERGLSCLIHVRGEDV